MGKIVFFPLLTGWGHLNIGLSISNRIFQLYGDKHEIYFLVNKGYAEKLSKTHPQIKCLIYLHPYLDKEKDEDDYMIRMFEEFGPSLKIKDRVEFINKIAPDEFYFYEQNKLIYPEITELIQKIQPDIFIYDQIMTTPVGIDQGIPYAMLLSCGPTFLGYHKLPPHQSGLPTEFTPTNADMWNDFLDKTYRTGKNKELHDLLNTWLKETNSPVNLDAYYHHNCPSPFFNIYNYPNVIDYDAELPGTWLKIQSAVLSPLPEPFVLPDELTKLDDTKYIKKYVYVSVGSMSSAYKPLMERIVTILAHLPYRFILSGGVLLKELKLSENIYAERFVNQLAVLQSVSCMVSHGGNNTFTECFYIGVPQIVMPLFADQIENATVSISNFRDAEGSGLQILSPLGRNGKCMLIKEISGTERITEKKLGSSLHPFDFTKEELQNEIEKVTTPDMLRKYREISTKIRTDKGIDKVCEKIVSYCK